MDKYQEALIYFCNGCHHEYEEGNYGQCKRVEGRCGHYKSLKEACDKAEKYDELAKTHTLKKGETKMTDKEKMQHILDTYNPESYEQFIGLYIIHFRKDFNDQRLLDLQNNINKCVYQYLIKSSYDIQIAKEKAQYVCLYLKGEMYKTKEDAIECLPLQIKHAEKVVEMLNDK